MRLESVTRPRALACAIAAWTLLGAAGLHSQVYWQPQPAPLVTAENEEWFRLGEPITYEGYVYYPAGARVFFDGNIMVRSGAYRGIPIYLDTTIEAYSRVFVPAAGGLLQPYERRRTGDAAGTTGSRAPSFPVTMAGEPSREPGLTIPGAAERDWTPTGSAVSAVGTTAPPSRNVLEAGQTPKGLNELFVIYNGLRWRSAGRAVRYSDERFVEIGRANGTPVYAPRNADPDLRVIYVPLRSGFVAPFERAGLPPRY